MTLRKNLPGTLFLVSVLVPFAAQASISAGDSLIVDFNAASDIDGFVVIRDDVPDLPDLGIGQNPAKGTGTPASGGLEGIHVGALNQQNDIAALYAPGGTASTSGHISLNPGDTLTLSLKFKTLHVNEAATPRLGIASAAHVNTATANGTNLDINGGKDIIGGTTANNWADGIAVNLTTANAKHFNIVDVVGGGVRTLYPDANGPYTLSDDTWYQYVAQITKATTAGQFDVSAVFNLLNADGTAFDSQISSVAVNFANAGLYSGDVIAGFTIVHDGEPDSVSNEYDDFSVDVIPEPGTLALLGLGVTALVTGRGRRTA